MGFKVAKVVKVLKEAAPNILSLGKIKRTFAFPLAYSQFGSAQYTSARQCSNKFGIALAYSYICQHKKLRT